MQVYDSEQRVRRLEGVVATYGWLIEYRGSERSVHPFETPESRRLFVAAVAQVSGSTAPVATERLSAALALRTWGDARTAWEGDDLMRDAAACDYQRLLYLRDLARNWCPAANAASRDMNAVALHETLDALGSAQFTRHQAHDGGAVWPGPVLNRIER